MNTMDDKQTFRQFCETELSQSKFNALYQLDGYSKNKITKALNYPESMSFDLLREIAKVTAHEPFFLAEQYNCAMDRMTARQYKRISKEESRLKLG